MISKDINKMIQLAMKEKDEVKVSTLKMLSNALHNALIEKKREELSEEEELNVVKREVRKRRDAIEVYRKAGVDDRVEREEQELAILEEFLPSQMNNEELKKIILDIIKGTGASDMGDMGKVIGTVMERTKGRVDGKRVAEMVKEHLDQS